MATEFVASSLPLSDGNPKSPIWPVDEEAQSHDHTHATDPTKDVEVDKIIVLSFRSLQLRRIADLQDNLLRLAAIKEVGMEPTTLSNHKISIDKALRDYGMQTSHYILCV